jgi:5-formyltetrahydrofolate cyclo-ligase
MTKDEIRKNILKKRGGLEKEFIEKASNKITEVFLEKFLSAKSFLLYSDFNNEVSTKSLLKILCENNKEIFLPIIKNNKLLEIGKYDNNIRLKKNNYGILEPVTKCNTKKFDVAVLPGVAFDKNCNRLGFGAGYYDRLMTAIDVAKSIGLAFEFQVVDELPSDAHDFPMDYVITERNLYRRRGL